jgi:hypothetical protein
MKKALIFIGALFLIGFNFVALAIAADTDSHFQNTNPDDSAPGDGSDRIIKDVTISDVRAYDPDAGTVPGDRSGTLLTNRTNT